MLYKGLSLPHCSLALEFIILLGILLGSSRATSPFEARNETLSGVDSQRTNWAGLVSLLPRISPTVEVEVAAC